MTPAKHQPPACRSCGKQWDDHPGIQQMCAKMQELETELARFKAKHYASIDTISRAVDHAEALLGLDIARVEKDQ